MDFKFVEKDRDRGVNFTFIGYPNAEILQKSPVEIADIIRFELENNSAYFLDEGVLSGCSMFVSPLHIEKGKKPHFHFLIATKNQMTRSSLDKKIDCFFSNQFSLTKTASFKVLNKRSLLRYFFHLDDTDKQQFDVLRNDDVSLHRGLTFSSDYFYNKVLFSFKDREKDKNDKFEDFIYCLQIIKDYKISSLGQFSEYLSNTGDKRAFKAYGYYEIRSLLSAYLPRKIF